MSPKRTDIVDKAAAAAPGTPGLTVAELQSLLAAQQQPQQQGVLSPLALLQLKQQQQLLQQQSLEALLLQRQQEQETRLKLIQQLTGGGQLTPEQQLAAAALLQTGKPTSLPTEPSTSAAKKKKDSSNSSTSDESSKPSSPPRKSGAEKNDDDDEDDEKDSMAEDGKAKDKASSAVAHEVTEEEAETGDAEEAAIPDDLENDTFPFKLYRMITKAEEEGKGDIVSFASNSRVFIIHKPRKFASDLMPDYFTTSRISSFQRQLNLYGFRRITEGASKGGYYHEHFEKGNLAQCRKIKRKKTTMKPPATFLGLGSNLGGGAGVDLASLGATTNLGSTLALRQLLLSNPNAGLTNTALAPALGLGSGLNLGLTGGALTADNIGLAALALQQQQQQQQQQQVDALQQLLLNQQRSQQR